MAQFFLTTLVLLSLHCLASANVDPESRELVGYEALEMLASSQFVRTVGNAWHSKIPRVEDSIVNLYTTELAAKEGCRWTSAERQSWTRKLRKIKNSVEKAVNTSEDTLGLGKLFKKSITRHGPVTNSILTNLDTVTSSVYRSGWMDLVVVKFGGYLREKMVKKQFQHPSCTWTGVERKEAGRQINEIVEKFVGQMNTEIFDIFNVLPQQHFKEVDKFDNPWNTDLFMTLFEPFYDDSENEKL